MEKLTTLERHLIYKEAKEMYVQCGGEYMCYTIENAWKKLYDIGQMPFKLRYSYYSDMCAKYFPEMVQIKPYCMASGRVYFGINTSNKLNYFTRLSMFDTIIERTKPKVWFQQSPHGPWQVVTIYGVPVNGNWFEDNEKIRITMYYQHNDYSYDGKLLRNNIREQTPCQIVRDWVESTFDKDKLRYSMGWCSKTQSWTEYEISKI